MRVHCVARTGRTAVNRSKPRPAVMALLLLCCLGGAGVAAAANDAGSAAREAAAMTGGRVLDVKTQRDGGQPAYLVKVLLPDGRVKLVLINGAGPRPRRR